MPRNSRPPPCVETDKPGDDSVRLAMALWPILTSILVIFLTTGAALPVLPLYIHERLGYGTFAVGLVAGTQFAASLVSRLGAGAFSDRRGSKGAVIMGLCLAIGAGVIYLVALGLEESPALSVTALLIGRAIMGAAESFVITGAQSWGLSVAKSRDSGKVIAWMGTALFVALALGAPIGSFLYEAFGLSAIGIATLCASAVSLLAIIPKHAEHAIARPSRNWAPVLKSVWLPGVAMMGASLGYGAMAVFAVLLFAQRGWEPAWLSFTAFAVTLVTVRIIAGGLPDRFGGAKIAMLFVIVQGAGMALIWLSPTALFGFVGAIVTGLGYSFVYPALGLEAIRRAPADMKASAIAVYSAFLDVALGILTPLLGLLAGVYGLGIVFAASAMLALCTVPVAALLMKRSVSNGP